MNGDSSLLSIFLDKNIITLGISVINMSKEIISMETETTQESVTLKLIKMSDIESKKVEWLWYPYIPFGKITILSSRVVNFV